MAVPVVNSGALITLPELNSSSPHFRHGASLRVVGKLEEYSVETAIAVIVDGDANLKVNTQHLNMSLRVGSLYQFIGELLIHPNNEAILEARIGRNIDGMDLKLYKQSLQLLKGFID
ncbi:CST complex subunit TEN1 [Impatiens glandulifera]|uniref:CST complex subunit TEN1 n=1 Tax=Impatiens glandulifera TaxID=253017 RepID=UPI001FB14D14|nr:CST complex subunit TEN1 [Impatiens glandulifera]